MRELELYNVLLQELRAAKGATERKAILKKHVGEVGNLATLLKWTLDPLITFGIKTMPKPVAFKPSYTYDWDGLYDLVQDLKYRHLTGKNLALEVGGYLNNLSPGVAPLWVSYLPRSLDAVSAPKHTTPFSLLTQSTSFLRCWRVSGTRSV
jgi:hypothetical protein